MTERPVERTSTRTPRDRTQETAVRAPLGERISAKLSNATDEHRANANPESRQAAKKAAVGARRG